MKLNHISSAVLALFVSPAIWAADTATTETTADNGATELVTVSVRAKAARAISEATNSYQRDRVNLGLLGRQNAFTTPITVVNYDEKAFADKNPRNLVDAIAQTDASVMAFGGETNTIQGLYVRGLQLDSRQFSVNGLAGMYSAYSSPTANVGAAQLIKGASSATVGMDPEGAVGSSVNIETKKAPDEGIRRIGLSVFGKNRWQPEVDIGQRFGANKQWGVRLNAKYRDGDTMRREYSENTKEAAINIDYRGETFQAALDAAYSKRDTTGGRARVQDIQGFGFKLPEAPNGKINLVPAWQRQAAEDKSVMFTFNWTPSDWVAISGGIGRLESLYSGNFDQLRITNTKGTYRSNGSLRRDQEVNTTSANLKARGYFQTGNISHNWNVAFDHVSRTRFFMTGNQATPFSNLNIYNPIFPAAPIWTALTTPATNERVQATSIALSDTLGFADDKFRLTLGGRLQWIKQKNNLATSTTKKYDVSTNRFSPMLLAAWVPSNDITVYGNYMEDLEPGQIDDESNTMSQPRVSKQIEFGVRKNWGNVVTTANIYQITKPTFWRSSGAEQGKERIRGLELSAYANLLNKTLRPYIGVSFTKHDLIDSPSYRNVLLNGTQVSVPRVIAKAGVEWDTPFIQGLTLNAGIQHYGKSYQDANKTYAFPSYTIVDAGVKYTVKTTDTQTLTIRGGVENLFNKNYWQVQRGQQDRSFAVVGMPRTFWLKMDYTF